MSRIDWDKLTKVLALADSGTGISPADLPTVMTPFVQVDSALTRRHTGSGKNTPPLKKQRHAPS